MSDRISPAIAGDDSAEHRPQPSGADALRYIREQYRVPAWPGRRVVVDGEPGIIVGARLDVPHLKVRFAGGARLPCHPTWRVEYVDEPGLDPAVEP